MSTGISAGEDDCPCFFTFYYYDPIQFKITIFSLHLFLFTFFVTIIILVNSQAPLQKKE